MTTRPSRRFNADESDTPQKTNSPSPTPFVIAKLSDYNLYMYASESIMIRIMHFKQNQCCCALLVIYTRDSLTDVFIGCVLIVPRHLLSLDWDNVFTPLC